MKMKKYLCIALGLSAAFNYSSLAHATEGLSANIGVTNNYVWRGVTQTDDKPAVSGGIDYASEMGVYVGTWASNVDFGDDASTELDLYLGFANDVGEFSYDFGYVYYGYPDGDELDFGEVYGSLAWNFLSVGVSTTAHSDWSSNFGDDIYVEANLTFEILGDIELELHAGSYNFDDGLDYQDYNISLSKSGFSFMLSQVSEDEIDDDYKVIVSYTHEIDL
ncbi:TorF family putative porin [Shewanella nanhaiensis]|uniref:TorF family putative porin n=1 Tax=Shewanella nanhaiensis TaxID=2864872 RepID=A0ABS7E7V5_9GAMM|nr:TorF family putative porin [Shewanella nanhaiensis]MBW8185763.1 TorF family putative porin [Shewanella nanhaiensis]